MKQPFCFCLFVVVLFLFFAVVIVIFIFVSHTKENCLLPRLRAGVVFHWDGGVCDSEGASSIFPSRVCALGPREIGIARSH